jgi:hypothetical protein
METRAVADKMHSWELVWSDTEGVPNQHTLRMRVPGGWLYRHNVWRPEGDVESMVFVPIQSGQALVGSRLPGAK